MLLSVSGPPGVGKNTLASVLCRNHDFRQLRTCTTRPRRKDEDERAYKFLTPAQFDQHAESNSFWRTISINSHLYGVTKKALSKCVGCENRNLVILTHAHALQLKHENQKIVAMLLLPDTRERLQTRLIRRGETKNSARRMLEAFDLDWMALQSFDLIEISRENNIYQTAGAVLRMAGIITEK